MIIQESEQDNVILIDCQHCGSFYPVDDFRANENSELWARIIDLARCCPDCQKKIDHQMQKMAEEQKRSNEYRKLLNSLFDAGFPREYIFFRGTDQLMVPPPRPAPAMWIEMHSDSHILLSGETGSGKSTSACYIGRKKLAEGKNVRYTSLSALNASWREARISQTPKAEKKFFNYIFNLDLIIIDEVIGKQKITEASREMLFRIIEGVNAGQCRARIWLLGEFFSGSLEQIFGNDTNAVLRRLAENFCCGRISPDCEDVQDINVYPRRTK